MSNKILDSNKKKESIHHKSYEFLEHTADIYVASFGKSLEEVFENSALALFDCMTDVSKIDQIFCEEVIVVGHDAYALLYNWLELFIIKFETENKLFSKFKINKIRQLNSQFSLKAFIFGENFNPNKHPSKVEIKAVTYHNMEIIHNDSFMAKFLLDI